MPPENLSQIPHSTLDPLTSLKLKSRGDLTFSRILAFTRTPASGLPATYEGTNDPDQLILLDQASDITISGLDADDTIVIGTGALAVAALSNYKVYGNDGDDAISQTGGQLANSTIQGGNGEDTIFFDSGNSLQSIIRGGADNDTITVGGLNQTTVNGNKGTDTIRVTGNAFSSRVFGGSENDRIFVAGNVVARDSRFQGSKGADTITVATGANITGSSVFGGEGNDTLNVTSNSSTLYVSGDLGNDIINATNLGGNNSSIFGGDGTDIASVSATGDTDSTYTYMGAGGDTLTIGGLSENTVVFNRGESIAASASAIAAATVTNADTITFNNGVDRVTGFVSGIGGDVFDIDIDTDAAAFDIIDGVGAAGALSSSQVYFFRGTMAGNVFTVDNAAGTDSLLVTGGQNLSGQALLGSTTSAQVLLGNNGTGLVAANFA